MAGTTSDNRTKLIVAGVLVALAALFVFQNTARGEVRFLFWDCARRRGCG